MNIGSFLSNYLISLVALVGLIVLVALHDVTAEVAVPVIVGLTGVHVGANISGSTTPGIDTSRVTRTYATPSKDDTGV